MSSGRSWLQMGRARGQRVWKQQPEGGLAGLGRSPVSSILSPPTVSPGILGMADSRAWV